MQNLMRVSGLLVRKPCRSCAVLPFRLNAFLPLMSIPWPPLPMSTGFQRRGHRHGPAPGSGGGAHDRHQLGGGGGGGHKGEAGVQGHSGVGKEGSIMGRLALGPKVQGMGWNGMGLDGTGNGGVVGRSVVCGACEAVTGRVYEAGWPVPGMIVFAGSSLTKEEP